MVSVSLLLSVGALGNHVIRSRYLSDISEQTAEIRKPLSEFPNQVGSFAKIKDKYLEDIFLDVLKPDDYIMRFYANENRETVEMWVSYWKPLSHRNQMDTPDSTESFSGAQRHYPDNCFPNWGFKRLREYDTDFKISDQSRVPGAVRLFEKAGRQQCVLFWYRNERDLTPLTSRDSLKRAHELFHSWKQPISEHESQFVVTIIVPVTESYEEARKTAFQFADGLAPVLPEFGIDL